MLTFEFAQRKRGLNDASLHMKKIHSLAYVNFHFLTISHILDIILMYKILETFPYQNYL